MKADRQNVLDAELNYNTSELAEVSARLEKAKASFIVAAHDANIAAKSADMRRFDDEKDMLNGVLRGLSLQADSRAKLALKKGELARKKAEIKVV